MKINRFLQKPFLTAKEEKSNRVRIENTCDFKDGITEEEFTYFASLAAKQIEEREVEIKVDGSVVSGVVRSLKGSTVWLFKVDFNDYGHITGKYWITSENNDSQVPYRIASEIEKQILIKLGVIR